MHLVKQSGNWEMQLAKFFVTFTELDVTEICLVFVMKSCFVTE